MSWRASSGLRAWMQQRVSALYLVLSIAVLLGAVVVQGPVTYAIWSGWFAHPAINIAAVLFFGALGVHAWVGVRDVIIDYVHVTSLRFVLLMLVAALLFAMVAWVLRILLVLPNA